MVVNLALFCFCIHELSKMPKTWSIWSAQGHGDLSTLTLTLPWKTVCAFFFSFFNKFFFLKNGRKKQHMLYRWVCLPQGCYHDIDHGRVFKRDLKNDRKPYIGYIRKKKTPHVRTGKTKYTYVVGERKPYMIKQRGHFRSNCLNQFFFINPLIGCD